MTSDFLVIGGGIIGICVARELKRRYADSKVTLIEKEKTCAQHASGRNSGVLHAGFYYTADSFKAKFTRDGNAQLTEYCEARHIRINKCGKLVIAQSEADHRLLDELLRRGRNNGVQLEEVDEDGVKKIDPRALTCGRAIFSPTTSSVDPETVVRSMEKEAKEEGVSIHYGVSYCDRVKAGVQTSTGTYDAGYIVNAAGLYADHIARDFGFSQDYRILPFKGLYLYSNERPWSIRTNIYPVPDLRNPFLGVHFTVTVDGHAKIGPTAIPALWREQYQGNENFRMNEFLDILRRQVSLFLSSKFDFKRLAFDELRKLVRSHMVSVATALAKGVKKDNYRQWGRPGIRAQLLNIKEKKLEMDFVFEGDNRSFHILNAVSPGFTCCLPFSHFVCDAIAVKLA